MEPATEVHIPSQHERALETCWTACQSGDLAQIKDSFPQLSDADVKLLLRRTALRDLLEPARCLLEEGANAKKLPLATVISECSVAMLQLLAEYGVDYKSQQDNILLYALDNNQEALAWLLDHGVDINQGSNTTIKGVDRTLRDNTVVVLNEAAARGDIQLFDYLVRRGAQPSRSNALHAAAAAPSSSRLSKDEDRNHARESSAVMITHLISTYDMNVDADDSCGGLNELLQWRAGSSSGTPLNYAVGASNVVAAKALLRHGASIGDATRELAKSRDMKRTLDEAERSRK